jgi:hypothetical protein
MNVLPTLPVAIAVSIQKDLIDAIANLDIVWRKTRKLAKILTNAVIAHNSITVSRVRTCRDHFSADVLLATTWLKTANFA